MLHQFLENHKKEILKMTEMKALELAGVRPSSEQLRKGLPIFYQQLIEILILEEGSERASKKNENGIQQAVSNNDEPAMTIASGHPAEYELAISAGKHGSELLRLGYTVSHVVHAYGAMCQSITELATHKEVTITPSEFHSLNRCLDVAIAGAVTEFQMHYNTKEQEREIEHLGFLAHELRNTLMSINVSFEMIKKGAVGVQGSTGRIMETALKRMQLLIDQSLTEVRLRVDPKVHPEAVNLLQLVNQINTTAAVEAQTKNQLIVISIGPGLVIQADQQLLYSAISNLFQNAIKYSHRDTTIQVRASLDESGVLIEVEDECGGLTDTAVDLFRPYEQQNENRKGLGLGLTIAQKAIRLNQGTIDVKNLPEKGCIFQIKMPVKAEKTC